jgi:hypothetical protein
LPLTTSSQFLVTTTWDILRLKIIDNLQMLTVAKNILNTQLQTEEMGYCPSMSI